MEILFEGQSYEVTINPELEELIDSYSEEALEAYLILYYSGGDVDTDDFYSRYRGEFDSFAEFAKNEAESLCLLDGVPESLRFYVDVEKYFSDYGEYIEEGGFFFFNC